MKSPNGLAAVNFRKQAAAIINLLKENPYVEIVPLSSGLFAEALELYEEWMDKGWGLTDCTSFIVMRRYGIAEALTTDEHFQQTGFGSLVSRVAVTNTYKEIAHLSKSLHFSSRCLPGVLSGCVSFYHESARLDE